MCNYAHICSLFIPHRQTFKPFKFPRLLIYKYLVDIWSGSEEKTIFSSYTFWVIFNLNIICINHILVIFDKPLVVTAPADHPVFCNLHVLRLLQYNNALTTQCKWLTVSRSAKLQLKCSFDSLIMHTIKTKFAGSWTKIFFSLMPTIKQCSAASFLLWAFNFHVMIILTGRTFLSLFYHGQENICHDVLSTYIPQL